MEPEHVEPRRMRPDLARNYRQGVNLITSATSAGILATVLGLGLFGIGRSLWLDEAWVANSIRQPTLGGMFFYPHWLQTTPPLFLLLVRAAVRLTKPSNVAFRAIPLLMALAAAGLMLAVARRVIGPRLAALATAFVVFNLTAIEYSRTLKQYSGELAASAALLLVASCYLVQPSRKYFALLYGTVAITLPLSYPSLFLLPGIVLAVWVTGGGFDALSLAGIAAAESVALYSLLIRFNLALRLSAFWDAANDNKMTAGLAVAVVFCLLASIRYAVVFLRRKPTPRDWMFLICALPCLLLAIAAAAGLYPIGHRNRLFSLPCFVLLAMMVAEDLLEVLKARQTAAVLAIPLTLGLAGFAIADQVIGARNVPEEDYSAAVAFLRQHAAASDLILVHACCQEGFLLYSAMDHWQPSHLLFGDTGWPCCTRGPDVYPRDLHPRRSTEAAVIADVDAKIPRGYSGRVWLLFTRRPTHWAYTGLDEGELWRKHLWARGCPPAAYLPFAGLAISPMDCMPAR